MPAASSDDARGASPAASVLAPSEGETEDPRISAFTDFCPIVAKALVGYAKGPCHLAQQI